MHVLQFSVLLSHRNTISQTRAQPACVLTTEYLTLDTSTIFTTYVCCGNGVKNRLQRLWFRSNIYSNDKQYDEKSTYSSSHILFYKSINNCVILISLKCSRIASDLIPYIDYKLFSENNSNFTKITCFRVTLPILFGIHNAYWRP